MICPVLYVLMEVMHMKRTQLLEEIWKMRFEEAY
jgi:hypothetical protein